MVAMQQVWPNFDPAVDHLEVYERRRAKGPRPWVVLCMVTSVDGSVSVQGRSAPLGGPVDWAVLSALRGCADAIVVGAGTARSEDYGPPAPPEEVQERRLARGQRALPLMAVVSGSGNLDPEARLFSGPERVWLYLGGGVPEGRRQALGAVADLRLPDDSVAAAAVDGDTVDVGAVCDDLGAAGLNLILLEGGPRLNACFVAADLVDELCITRSPLLAPGGPGMITTEPTPAPRELRLERLLVADGMTFARYLRHREPHKSG